MKTEISYSHLSDCILSLYDRIKLILCTFECEMSVCMCVYVFVDMYLWICVRVYENDAFESVHVCMCRRVFVYVYLCLYMLHVCMHLCMNVFRSYVCMYGMYVCTCVYVFIYEFLCVCMYVCM